MEFLAVTLAIALPAMMSAFGQGWATTRAVESIARQPEAAGEIRGALLIALAFMEALTLFSFVIAYILSGKITVG
ncbi:ATP synthase F0 subunit C [Carboxydochorda subterranea]|uniref:ATP synthase subunit c n=1 Tax=Carboxydichorda subterranea TaxID=3109565 RepID=A0ABZ1BVW1_9FIRM|nr:ATP synthase F0 subunit C [Limnochorda sp. L945t]WRP16932.1 ATP synthase F0 subunit C [Limnochorda sp. L945t]